LWERIHAAELASPEDCRNWALEIAQSSAAEALHAPQTLAAELIRLRKISPFQANVLFGNLPIPLAIGPYRLTESLESIYGTNWFHASEARKAKDSSLLCYLLTAQELQKSSQRDWPPSLELAAKHVAVSHPTLDHWLFAGFEKSCVVGVCESLEGQSLSDVLRTSPLNWHASVALVEQIASGLKKLHDAGLVHGCVCTDSVWRVDENEFVLRRDPFFPPTTTYSKSFNSILVPSRERLNAVTAPELSLPNAAPNVQTDLYALGCLWYFSITRNSPLGVDPNGTAQSWASAHLTKSVNPLSALELPLPLQRCLAHLLAKNPSARFASASALTKAIEFALVETEKETLPQSVATSKASASLPSVPISKSETKPTIEIEKRIATNDALPVSTTVVPLAMEKSKQATSTHSKKNLGKSAQSTSSTNKHKNKPKNKNTDTKKKKKKPAWLLPAMIAGSCLFFGGLIAILVRNGSTTVPVVPNTNVATSEPTRVNPAVENAASSDQVNELTRPSTPASKPIDSVTEYFVVGPDDGQLLWAPPHSGSAYSLDLFPAGLETVVFVSGNLWHGQGVASAVSKWWSDAQPEFAKQFPNTPLLSDNRIQSVAIALYTSKNPGLPQAALRISFAQPVSIESILQGDSNFKLQPFDPKSVIKKGYWSNGLQYNATTIMMDGLQTDLSAKVKRVVIGPSELLASLPELNGGPPPLRRQLETLLMNTDSRSDLTILTAPSFLFGDGRELLTNAPELQDTLRELIDESMQAVLFATSLEPRWYMELRMLSSETRDVGKFASALKARLNGLPDEFEKSLSSGAVLHPYWRALGLRYPQMMRAMNRFFRIGLEDGQVVANVYLPTDAMTNVAITSWLALNQPMAAIAPNVASTPTLANKPPSKTIEEILGSQVTVSFEQESLEAALQLIASEVAESVLSGSGISMTIDGTSFQKEGITRNQSIRTFTQNSVPLRTVLTDLVRRANPVTTVQSATERNQKVVWVVLDDPDREGFKKIELTTRSNADAKKLKLPKEFVAE